MFSLENFLEKVEAIGHLKGSKTHSALSDALVAMSQHNLSSEEWEAVLQALSASGRSELEDLPLFTDDMWEEFNYGNVRPGDYVKVKPNAYDSDTGSKHNGLVGVLIRVSGRRCLVRYLTHQAPAQMRHPIDSLLSLKHGVQ